MTDALASLRSQFPILSRPIRERQLVYLDNAATTLKPKRVADTVYNHYLYESANIHRGVHYLSEEATRRYEAVRDKVRAFINAPLREEIIFTSGTTESINLKAKSYGRKFLKRGDEVLITHMEHHSNIVPWQQLRDEVGCTLQVAPIDDRGDVMIDEFAARLSPQTKIVSVVYVSNSLGTINPIAEMIRLTRAKAPEAIFVIDAAQAVAHMPVDVQALGCDFLAFSSHKLYGPTGTGVLFGRKPLLGRMPPFLGGGDMIKSVTFEKTTYAELPAKFEAGTPDIGGVIGLGEAIAFVSEIGFDLIGRHEHDLLSYGTEVLSQIEGVTLIGTAKQKASIIAFTLDNVHPHDIGSILDMDGIAIRAGHHCTQPVMQRFGVPATARASLSIYNTRAEIDALAVSIRRVREMFQ